MDVSFYGIVVPAGKKVEVTANYDEDVCETVHLTQVALGAEAAAGPHTVFVEKDGNKFAIGTLDKSRCPQFSCDITFAMDEVTLSHSGGSEVHITGYSVQNMLGEDEDSDGMMEGAYGHYASSDEEGSEGEEGSEEEEEDSEEEDEEAPAAVPLKQGGKLIKARARQLIDDEAEEDSEEEEEEEEDSEMEDDEDEEESEEEMPANGRVVRIAGPEDSSQEEELSSGEEEDEEEEGSEEEEEDSEEEAAPPPKQQQKQQKAAAAVGAKRPAPQQQPAAKTPQPAKKAKQAEQQQKVPATAPAKVAAAAGGPAGAATPSNDKEYLQALKAALQQGGPLKLAALGSKVKRPPNAPKIKVFIDKHPGTFKYDKANDSVSLV